MSPKLGFVNYAGEDTQQSFLPDKDYSPETNHVIDEEIRRLSDEAFNDTVRLVSENWEKVVAVAEALLRYETLTRDDVDRLMRGEALGRPTIADMLTAEANRPKPVAEQKPADSGPELGGAMPSPA